jgi:GTP-binding protein Era
MSDARCGFVALIGAPNAGKSTLINALVGSKVSVVSRKAQTTRTTVRGIVIEGAAQIIFVDTPGLFAPKRRLDRAMAASAWGAAADADVLALLIDARQEIQASARSDRDAQTSAPSDEPPGERPPRTSLGEQTEKIIRALRDSKAPKALVLNKIDLVERSALLALAAKLNAALKFEETFMVSAATGDGLDKLRERLGRMMPPGPWLYPEDQITDEPIRSLAAEITREKLFERLHDELPYQTTVETDQWKALPDGSVRIEQTIFVTRDSHKKIVIGEGGRTIKAIGAAARKEIAEANDGPVHLFLFVKVRANWLDDPERYRAMGLEFPKR